MEEQESGVRLTGLWKHEKPDGSFFYSGKLGTAQLIVVKVKEKTKPNDPDLIVYITKVRSDQERSAYTAPTQTGGGR